MNERNAVPIIVVAQRPDHVEAINSTLRNAGHPVHCTHIPDTQDLSDALAQINPELVLAFSAEANAPLKAIADIRNRDAPGVPILEVRDEVSEDIVANSMRLGAQDVVSLRHRDRLQWVFGRELRAFRLERALNETLTSATEYKRQLQAFMEGSGDAIAHVHDGIIVDTNPAWLELFGYPETEAVVGTPVMDFFDTSSHAALKGAVVACSQGKWTDHELRVQGQCSDGSLLALKLKLQAVDFDGDRCIRICVPAQSDNEREPEERLTEFVHHDPATGFLHRRQFLEELNRQLATPARGGVRALAYVTPDKFRRIKTSLGPVACEDVLLKLARIIEELVIPEDLKSRFGGTIFTVLMSRGTTRDIEEWAASLRERVAAITFEAGGKSISITCTVGIRFVGTEDKDIEELLTNADAANEQGRENGGNQIVAYRVDPAKTTSSKARDEIWGRLIKAALVDERFRLKHQPIASLKSQDKDMYDVVVRMIDPEGKEVLPGEFLPTAERQGLMKTIDRWVISAAIQFCVSRRASRVFIRLSADSVLDDSLPDWIEGQVKNARLTPSSVCIQISEETAIEQLKPTTDLVQKLGEAGFFFAIEHFGVGQKPESLLEHFGTDYVKIDGSLMQGLASNLGKQERIRSLVKAATERDIETIAERVEDANTMAVLWQLGVENIQGYYVQEPEVVLEEQAY